MSNDVHLAKVSKIQRGFPKTSSAQQNRKPKEVQTTDENHEMSSPRPDDRSPDCHPDISDNNISSCSTLDIVNLTQQQLEGQVRDLTKRLQKSEEDRNCLERQLKDSNAEKEVCLRRLDVVSTAHECRITEMHCVIAELSKKLRAKQENVIIEEQEPADGSDGSYQEGSIYNSELNLTNPDAECQTDPLDSAVEDEMCLISQHQDDYFGLDLNEQDMKLNENSKGQIEALQEEVLHLKAQIALLQSELANSVLHNEKEIAANNEKDTNDHSGAFECDIENDSNCSSERLLFVQSDKIPARTLQQDHHMINAAGRREEMRVSKMAERVKLRCAATNEVFPGACLKKENNVTTDLMKNFVQQFDQNSSNAMLNSLVKSVEYDNELVRKVEQLKMQNAVLSLTLDECKEHCEHLYLLCGKYESNAIALQLALNFDDRAIEAYDVMLALLESKLALIKEKSIAAEDSRKAVESVARHLLDRLECEKNLCENSLGPWQSTFNIPEKAHTPPWTADDDNRLRYHVSKLKGCRSNVQNTIVNLESPFSEFYEKIRINALENEESEAKNQERSAQLDLEMAVVMQDLLNLREENVSLKMKFDDLQKERQFAENRISILESALNELQLQLNTADAHNVLIQRQRDSICFVGGSGALDDGAFKNRISYSEEAEHSALIEQQLVEALTRETELKGRIQTLIASVAATQKFTESRDLDSNLNMAQLLEQNKRKYQTRIRKLEQKLLDLSVNCSSNTAASCNIQQQHDVPESSL